MLSCQYCLSPQAVERRESIPFFAACQQSVVQSKQRDKSMFWSCMQRLRKWLGGSLNSSEAVSRYMLWRHHRQKPQPSPHTAPNDKRAGSLGEGEGLGEQQRERRWREGRRGINTVRGEESWVGGAECWQNTSSRKTSKRGTDLYSYATPTN